MKKVVLQRRKNIAFLTTMKMENGRVVLKKKLAVKRNVVSLILQKLVISHLLSVVEVNRINVVKDMSMEMKITTMTMKKDMSIKSY
jgi:ribosomal protein L34